MARYRHGPKSSLLPIVVALTLTTAMPTHEPNAGDLARRDTPNTTYSFLEARDNDAGGQYKSTSALSARGDATGDSGSKNTMSTTISGVEERGHDAEELYKRVSALSIRGDATEDDDTAYTTQSTISVIGAREESDEELYKRMSALTVGGDGHEDGEATGLNAGVDRSGSPKIGGRAEDAGDGYEGVSALVARGEGPEDGRISGKDAAAVHENGERGEAHTGLYGGMSGLAIRGDVTEGSEATSLDAGRNVSASQRNVDRAEANGGLYARMNQPAPAPLPIVLHRPQTLAESIAEGKFLYQYFFATEAQVTASMVARQDPVVMGTGTSQSPIDQVAQLTAVNLGTRRLLRSEPTYGTFYNPNNLAPLPGGFAMEHGLSTDARQNIRVTWSLANGEQTDAIVNVYNPGSATVISTKDQCIDYLVCTTWADATFVDLLDLAAISHINKLNLVVQLNIVDPITLTVANWARTGDPPGTAPRHFAPGYQVKLLHNGPGADGYWAMLGTPIGQQVSKLLYSRKNQLPRRYIQSINIFSDDSANHRIGLAFQIATIEPNYVGVPIIAPLTAAQISQGGLGVPLVANAPGQQQSGQQQSGGLTPIQELVSRGREVYSQLVSTAEEAVESTNQNAQLLAGPQHCTALLGGTAGWARTGNLRNANVFEKNGPAPAKQLIVYDMQLDKTPERNDIVKWNQVVQGTNFNVDNMYNVLEGVIYALKSPEFSGIRNWDVLAYCDYKALGGTLSDLNYVFQFGVDEYEAEDVIQWTRTGNYGPTHQMVKYPANFQSWAYSATDSNPDHFMALLGTEFGQRVSRMLYTHKQELGGKTITAINVYKDQSSGPHSIGAPVLRFKIGDAPDKFGKLWRAAKLEADALKQAGGAPSVVAGPSTGGKRKRPSGR